MIMVDDTNCLDGTFGYTNEEGAIEYIDASYWKDGVNLWDKNGNNINEVYTEDIPKLILALQAAYDYKTK